MRKKQLYSMMVIIVNMVMLTLFGGCRQQAHAEARMPSPHTHQHVLQWTVDCREDFRYHFLNNVKTFTLYQGTPEAGTFNHHPYTAYYKGTLFAQWDSQAKDENASGQHGVFTWTTDGGKTWSSPRPLFPPLAENVPADESNVSSRFQTSWGFIEVDGGFYAVTDVAEWKTPAAKKIKPRRNIGVLCRSVKPDGTLGDIFWLQDKAPDPVPGFPGYPAGDPVLVQKINDFFKHPAHAPQLDFGRGSHPLADDDHHTGEPVPAWQLADGTWVRLYRDGGSRFSKTLKEDEASKARRNYVSFSYDDGETWTRPTRTRFPDACARTYAGKLPDGQVYVLNNVLPLSTKNGGRALLAVSLSRDGLNFDRMAVLRFLPPAQRFQGRAKSVGYAYPHSVIIGDSLWVLYSVNKEDIEIARIPLSELYAIQ